MKLSIVLMIGCCATVWGQKPTGLTCVLSTDPSVQGHCEPHYDSAPLKCGKWQHVESERIVREPTAHGSIAGLRVDKTPRCADDLHVGTEKEWQNLRYHIRELESRICFGKDGLLRDCKIVNKDYKLPSHEEVEASDPFKSKKLESKEGR